MRYIWVKTSFEALHCWPECPIEEVAFLRNLHRHTFHVTVKIGVEHNDREIEFFCFQRQVNLAIKQRILCNGINLGRKSCEDMADIIYSYLADTYPYRKMIISVSEDGEVGAEVEYEQ